MGGLKTTMRMLALRTVMGMMIDEDNHQRLEEHTYGPKGPYSAAWGYPESGCQARHEMSGLRTHFSDF